jgi:hypothetical protein
MGEGRSKCLAIALRRPWANLIFTSTHQTFFANLRDSGKVANPLQRTALEAGIAPLARYLALRQRRMWLLSL